MKTEEQEKPKLTLEARRMAIAEACGWVHIEKPQFESGMDEMGACGITSLTKRYWDANQLPNYPEDLNAMHEAEKVLTTVGQWTEYTRHLFQIIQPNQTLWEAACAPDMDKKMYILAGVVRATAAQREEAFLLAIGKT